jgi:hypothetical protein
MVAAVLLHRRAFHSAPHQADFFCCANQRHSGRYRGVSTLPIDLSELGSPVDLGRFRFPTVRSPKYVTRFDVMQVLSRIRGDSAIIGTSTIDQVPEIDPQVP